MTKIRRGEKRWVNRQSLCNWKIDDYFSLRERESEFRFYSKKGWRIPVRFDAISQRFEKDLEKEETMGKKLIDKIHKIGERD